VAFSIKKRRVPTPPHFHTNPSVESSEQQSLESSQGKSVKEREWQLRANLQHCHHGWLE
jgi:hypothetical protein